MKTIHDIFTGAYFISPQLSGRVGYVTPLAFMVQYVPPFNNLEEPLYKKMPKNYWLPKSKVTIMKVYEHKEDGVVFAAEFYAGDIPEWLLNDDKEKTI